MKGIIPDKIFFRIGDAAKILGVKTYVIRFWETEFPFLAPEKAVSGQRVYQRSEIEMLVLVKHLLHVERYSIEGAKKRITELRRAGKLKEILDQVVRGKVTEESVVNGSRTSPEVAPQGMRIDKSRITALQAQVEELQALIREPEKAGIVTPALKTLQ